MYTTPCPDNFRFWIQRQSTFLYNVGGGLHSLPLLISWTLLVFTGYRSMCGIWGVEYLDTNFRTRWTWLSFHALTHRSLPVNRGIPPFMVSLYLPSDY